MFPKASLPALPTSKPGRHVRLKDMANLSSSTVMLTGAGGALATAIAQELEDAGAQLVLVGRGEAGLKWEETIDPRGLAKSVAHALTRPDRAHVTELKVYPDH